MGNERVSKQEIFLPGRDQSCSPRRGRAAASVVTSSLRLLKCCRADAPPASGLGRLSPYEGERMKVRGGRYHQLPPA